MILVTGAAGFIGFHLSQLLLACGEHVVGLDNINDYYDVRIKHARLEQLSAHDNFTFIKCDLTDRAGLDKAFKQHRFTKVVNLAAQAGVRYSIDHPHKYVDSNLIGFVNIIECCRHHDIEHLVYASTSSVYGANSKQPFSEQDSVSHPLALYAATKRANELIAHSYASLYGLPSTGLRFFTVYGPWGRPDMALFLFTKKILAGEPIDVYNHGKMRRDFTYVSDIVSGIACALDHPAQPDSQWDAANPSEASSFAPYRLYNIGRGAPVDLMEFIHAIEDNLGKKAQYNMMPMQAGDVPSSHADVGLLAQDLGYAPKVSVQEGVANFVTWYRTFYQV